MLKNIDRKIVLFAGFLLLLVFAVGVYFLTRSNFQEIPILLSDFHITKKRPDNPGGIVIPNSNSVIFEMLDSKNVNSKVNILSASENPINLDRNRNFGKSAIYTIDDIIKNLESDQFIHDEDFKSDDSEFDDLLDKNIMPLKIIEKNNQKELSDLDVIISDKNKYGFGKKLSEQSSEVFYLQLSLAYSIEEANFQWKNIQKKHSSILSKMSLVTKKIRSDKHDAIFFLVMAGPYHSIHSAKSDCKKLISKRQNCIINSSLNLN